MVRITLVILALIQFVLSIALSPPSFGQDWELRVKPRGTLRVVDLLLPSVSTMLNYAEGLVTLDKDNNWAPCLAQDWRWIDERTIEFKLRGGVTFHNGEKFDAEAVRVNWEEYRRMENPRPLRHRGYVIPDETVFEIIDEYRVRFTLPEPDGMAFVKFQWFLQIAPAFFAEHKFEERNYGYLQEAGPWGTGPFKFVEGSVPYAGPSDRLVLEAYEDYWDLEYPKVKKVVFDNTLIGDRKEAMRLCMENEGAVDIVSHIRPLDTLRVAESPFAKVVKSRDVAHFGGIFNQRKKDSKWRDIRLRKAVNYAVNRKELRNYGAKGNAFNLGGFIPPGAYGNNPDLALYTYDTPKARSLLAEVGYPDGFEVKIITPEAWKLEAQIIGKMLERIGLRPKLDVLTQPDFWGKFYIPSLTKPPEEQDWDIAVYHVYDWTGHTGATFLTYGVLEESDFRWIEYDQVYEEMFTDMARTVDSGAQEEKIRQMVQYIYDRALIIFIYSPLTLCAVNEEVSFVPQKLQYLRLKETSVTDNHWSVRAEQGSDEE